MDSVFMQVLYVTAVKSQEADNGLINKKCGGEVHTSPPHSYAVKEQICFFGIGSVIAVICCGDSLQPL